MKHHRRLLYTALLLTLCACGAKTDTIPVTSIVQTESEGPAQEEADLQAEGITLYESSQLTGIHESIEKIGEINKDAKLQGRPLRNASPLTFSDGTVILRYTLYGEGSTGAATCDVPDLVDEEYFISLFDIESGSFDHSISFGNSYPFVNMCGDKLWVTNEDDAFIHFKIYDSSLTLQKSFDLPSGTEYKIAENGRFLCYLNDTGLQLLYPQNSDEPQAVTLDRMFCAKNLYGILSDEKDRTFALCEGLAGDLKTYIAAFDLESGECLYLKKSEDLEGFIASRGSYPIQERYDIHSFDISCYKNGRLVHFYTDDSTYPDTAILKEDGYIFSEIKEQTFSMVLYDREGNRIASEGLETGQDYACFYDNPVPYKDHSFLFSMIDKEGSSCLYVWTPKKDYGELPGLTCELKEAIPEICELHETYTKADITPGQCLPELMDERAYADSLEKKYGIGILISEECRGFTGNYIIDPLNDLDDIRKALDLLDHALSKYPEGFFKQFSGDGVSFLTGIDFYLTGELTGIRGNVVADANGMATTLGSRVVIYANCKDYHLSEGTFHHEISHAIESRIAWTDELFVDEEDYAKLNPMENCYAESYSGYESSDHSSMDEYLYTMSEGSPDVYFTDSYALTRATEDRARIFENVMADDRWVPIENYPHLLKKLSWMQNLIRLAFDSTGWTDVYWERF